MANKLDLRQSVFRGTLSQIGNQPNPEGDNIVNSINNQLTPLLKMSATATPSLTVNIGAGDLTDSETGHRRAIPHVGAAYVNFTSGTVVLPNVSGGNITCTPGGTTVLNVAAGNYAAILIYLDGVGNLNAVVGADAASESAAISNLPPAPDETLPLGFIIAQNISGTIQNITQNKIVQFGTGSGGAGGAGNITEEALALRNSLNSTHFKYLSPVVFKVDKQAFIDTANSTGTFNLIDSTYTLAATQILQTVNLFDSVYHNAETQDLKQVMLTAFYKAGHIDTNASYRISRNSGLTWESINLIRNNGTNEFSAIKDYGEEHYGDVELLDNNSDITINTTTVTKIGQEFSFTADRWVKDFTFEVNKLGPISGSLIVKVVRDSSGNPSLLPADVLGSFTFNITQMKPGLNKLTAPIKTLPLLASTTYHLLFEVDSVYNANYSATQNIKIRTNNSASAPFARTYNGSTWTGVTGTAVTFDYKILNSSGAINNTTSQALNTGTQYKLSQVFSIASTTAVKEFLFEVQKTGTIGGFLIVKLVKDSSGNPSSSDLDIISAKTYDIGTLATGTSQLIADFGLQILKPGDYHLVFETDAVYKSQFVSATQQIAIRTNGSASTPYAKAYNNTLATPAWGAIANNQITFRYSYKIIGLLARVIASAASKVTALGIFYGEEITEVTPVSRVDIIVGTQDQVDAGLATHTNIQNAINDAGFGRSVRILAGTFVGSVEISQDDLVIYGEGSRTVIQGNLIVYGKNNTIKNLKIDGNLTMAGSSEYNSIYETWLTGNLIDDGTGNSLTLLWD